MKKKEAKIINGSPNPRKKVQIIENKKNIILISKKYIVPKLKTCVLFVSIIAEIVSKLTSKVIINKNKIIDVDM